MNEINEMNPSQLRKIIEEKEDDIKTILEKNGHPSSLITLENKKTKTNNKMLNQLKSYFNYGFFGFYSTDLKKQVSSNNTSSLYQHLSKSLLQYYFQYLTILEDTLRNYGFIETTSEINGLKNRMASLGRSYAIRYKKEHGKTPFNELKYFNSPKYLEKIVLDKFEFFNGFDEETIKQQLEQKSNNLTETLPKSFSDKKGYGATLGEINKGFYSFEQKEILERFRQNGVKGIEKITKVMDKEHFTYRLTILHFTEAYKNYFTNENYNSFISKIAIITHILKEDYIRKHGIEPYYGLLDLAKEKEKNKKKQYKLSKEKQTILIDDGIQESFFDTTNKSKKL